VYRQCVYSVFNVSPLHLQSVKCIAIAYSGCSLYRRCVYRVFNVSPLSVQRVQCIAIAYTACSLYRQCIYSVHCIASPHTECSMRHQCVYFVFNVSACLTAGIALLFNIGARWDGWLTPRPGRLPPPGMTRYPLCRRLGGTQGRSIRVRKISPLSGFDLRIVQPVASRYTD
jgi:hypothetical protein